MIKILDKQLNGVVNSYLSFNVRIELLLKNILTIIDMADTHYTPSTVLTDNKIYIDVSIEGHKRKSKKHTKDLHGALVELLSRHKYDTNKIVLFSSTHIYVSKNNFKYFFQFYFR